MSLPRAPLAEGWVRGGTTAVALVPTGVLATHVFLSVVRTAESRRFAAELV